MTNKYCNIDMLAPLRGELPKVTAGFDAVDADIKAIEAVNSFAEIGVARVSNAKFKTFTDLDARFEEIEQDVILAKVDLASAMAAILSLASGAPKPYATLAALQAAFPTGDTNAYVVVADGKWYYWLTSAWTPGGTYQSTAIAAKSVTYDKTDFLSLGENLFNVNTITASAYMSGATIVTGSTTYDLSDHVAVKPSTTYTLNYGMRFVCFFDTNKNYVSTAPDNPSESAPRSFTTPSNAAYVRVSVYKTKTASVMLTEGSTAQAFKAWGYKIPFLYATLLEQDVINNENIKNGVIAPEKLNFAVPIKNLFNEETRSVGYFINTGVDGTLVANATYDTSDYISVKSGVTYAISRCRKLGVYDANHICVLAQNQDMTIPGPTTVTPGQDGFIRVSFYAADVATSQVEVGSTQTSYSPHFLIIDNLGLPDKRIFKGWLEQSVQDSLDKADEAATNGGIQTLTIANADRIGLIGDSYTESSYTPKGKAYISKLSLFSDYNFENFAQSGDTYRGNLDRIRKKTPIYHSTLSWQDFKPKYAFLVSYTNDLKYMDNAQYANDLRAIIETVRSLGAIPIVATEYHNNFGAGIQNLMRQVAREYGAEFVDIVPKVSQLRGSDYAAFWNGSHPGARSNSLESDNYGKHLSQLPGPRQSLKIFRLRPSTTVGTLDDLIFNTNVERAKKFKEIMIGHSALVDPKYVDQCTTASGSRVISEYLMLQNGEDVEFTDYALVSAIVPSTALHLNTLRLILNDTSATVYVKNIVANSYPSPTYYQRFDTTGSPTLHVGDTYTSNNSAFSGTTFTLQQISGASMLMSPYKGGSNAGGTLTRVSGTGSTTIVYGYTAPGFDSSYPTGKQDIGHWQQLSLSSGKYDVPPSLIAECVDYDKVHFLVQKTGAFNLNSVAVEWSGAEDKVYKVKDLKLEEPTGSEMLAQPLLGATQLSGWTLEGSPTAYVPADGNLPSGCSGCVDVSTTKKVSQAMTFPSNVNDVEFEIKVWARYFPAIYDPETDYSLCLITEDSYDYGDIAVDIIQGSQSFTLSDKVGLHWKEVTFRAYLPAGTTTQILKIYTKDKTLQLTKVSARTV